MKPYLLLFAALVSIGAPALEAQYSSAASANVYTTFNLLPGRYYTWNHAAISGNFSVTCLTPRQEPVVLPITYVTPTLTIIGPNPGLAETVSCTPTNLGPGTGGGGSTLPVTPNIFAGDNNGGARPATASDIALLVAATGGGTAQAQTVTLAQAVTNLTLGLEVRWIPIAANTGAGTTIAVNGLPAKTITKNGTSPLAANDITTLAIAIAYYDGTRFQLLNPQTTPPAGITALTSDVSAAGMGSVAATVVRVNGATIPTSQPCAGTNGAGQIVAGTCVTGTSGDVTTSGSGVATATVVKVNGGAIPASQPCVGTNSSNQIVAGTCGTGTPLPTVTVTDLSSMQATVDSLTGGGNIIIAANATNTLPNAGILISHSNIHINCLAGASLPLGSGAAAGAYHFGTVSQNSVYIENCHLTGGATGTGGMIIYPTSGSMADIRLTGLVIDHGRIIVQGSSGFTKFQISRNTISDGLVYLSGNVSGGTLDSNTIVTNTADDSIGLHSGFTGNLLHDVSVTNNHITVNGGGIGVEVGEFSGLQPVNIVESNNSINCTAAFGSPCGAPISWDGVAHSSITGDVISAPLGCGNSCIEITHIIAPITVQATVQDAGGSNGFSINAASYVNAHVTVVNGAVLIKNDSYDNNILPSQHNVVWADVTTPVGGTKAGFGVTSSAGRTTAHNRISGIMHQMGTAGTACGLITTGGVGGDVVDDTEISDMRFDNCSVGIEMYGANIGTVRVNSLEYDPLVTTTPYNNPWHAVITGVAAQRVTAPTPFVGQTYSGAIVINATDPAPVTGHNIYRTPGAQIYTVAGLPPTPGTGTFALARDGLTSTSCATGGGAFIVLCYFNGTAWVNTATAQFAQPIATNVSLPYTDSTTTDGLRYFYTVSASNAVSETRSPMGLSATSGAYVNLPQGAYLSTPGSSSYSPGSAVLDVRMKMWRQSWGPNPSQYVVYIGELQSGSEQFAVYSIPGQDGLLFRVWTSTGSPSSVRSPAIPLMPGETAWIRATYTPSTGTAAFYSSRDDQATWTLWYSDSSIGPNNIVTPGTPGPLLVGQTSANYLDGHVLEARVLIGGTEVSGFKTYGVTPGVSTFTGNEAETWTLVQDTASTAPAVVSAIDTSTSATPQLNLGVQSQTFTPLANITAISAINVTGIPTGATLLWCNGSTVYTVSGIPSNWIGFTPNTSANTCNAMLPVTLDGGVHVYWK